MSQAAEASPLQNKISRIENKLDQSVAASINTSSAVGGVAFGTMIEVMEFSKLMAVSDVAIPKHLRGNVGACVAVCIQAIEWRMSPYAVANKSYVVNDRISYESQLIHAVIEQRAPLVGRLRCSFSGSGDSRKCKVWANVRGESEAFEFESSDFGSIQPKNSPLWKTKPDLQLFYNASRDWARMYFPDVILGVYADDEIARAMPTIVQESRPTPIPVITEEQRTSLVALAQEIGVIEKLGSIVNEAGFEMLANITVDRFDDVCTAIKAAGGNEAVTVDGEVVEDVAPEVPAAAPPIDARESKRLDLITAIDDLLGEISKGDIEEINKLLDGRVLKSLTDGQLKDFHIELKKKAK
jgi:hypothetical protein